MEKRTRLRKEWCKPSKSLPVLNLKLCVYLNRTVRIVVCNVCVMCSVVINIRFVSCFISFPVSFVDQQNQEENQNKNSETSVCMCLYLLHGDGNTHNIKNSTKECLALSLLLKH
jgi:hypothetical protein